MFTFSILI